MRHSQKQFLPHVNDNGSEFPAAMRMLARLFLPCLVWSILACPPPLRAQWLPLNPVHTVEPQADGALVVLERGFLRLQASPEGPFERQVSVDGTGECHANPPKVSKATRRKAVRFTLT